jgi:rhodanese-related sulfurtransferase
VRLNDQWIDQPLRWKKPRRIFVCAHGDLFHEAVPDEWIDRIFAVMALAPQHIFLVLTKRPERMREYIANAAGRVADAVQPLRTDRRAVGPLPHIDPGQRWWPLPNCWPGVSVEDQPTADERIPLLLDVPEPQIPDVPRETPVVAYCLCSGQASSTRAARWLEAAGYTDVAVLTGGLPAWEAADFPRAPIHPDDARRITTWIPPPRQATGATGGSLIAESAFLAGEQRLPGEPRCRIGLQRLGGLCQVGEQRRQRRCRSPEERQCGPP